MTSDTWFIGKNTTIAIDSSDNLSYIESIGNIKLTSDDVETTVYSSSDYKTHKQGLKDMEALEIGTFWNAADSCQNYLFSLHASGKIVPIVITFDNTAASTFTFYGYIKDLAIDPPKDDAARATITIQPANTTADPAYEA
jgi:hypothetical protein